MRQRKIWSLWCTLVMLVFVGFAAGNIFGQSNPLTVTKTSTDRSTNEYERLMVVKNKIVYEPDDQSGTLKITDATDPKNPVISYANGDYMYWPERLAQSGNYVYVSSNDTTNYNYNPSSPSRISIFDISDPTDVNQVGVINVSAAGLSSCTSVQAMHPVPFGVLVDVTCGGTPYLLALNGTTPSAPAFDAQLNYSSYATAIQSVQSAGSSEYVFFDSNSSTLSVKLDVSSSASLPVTETIPVPSGLTGIGRTESRVGNNVYMVATPTWPNTNLYTIDVSTPATPTITNTLQICTNGGGAAEPKIMPSNRLLVTCSAQIANVDISNPASPSLGAYSTTVSGTDMAVEGNTIYYSAYNANEITLSVFDDSVVGQAPTFVGAKVIDFIRNDDRDVIQKPGSDTVFLMARETPVIRAVDTTDPSDLKEGATSFLTQNGRIIPDFEYWDSSSVSTSSDGHWMYIFEKQSGTGTASHLTVLDISDPDNVTVASRTDAPVGVTFNKAVVSGNHWYLFGDTQFLSYSINTSTGAVSQLDSVSITAPVGVPANFYSNRTMAIVGNNAILMFASQSALSVDISDPTNLGTAQAVSLPALASYSGMSMPLVVGTHMLLLSSAGFNNTHLYSIDVSDPSSMSVSSDLNNNIFSQYPGAALQMNGANTVMFTQETAAARIDVSNLNNLSITSQTNGTDGLFPAPLNGFNGLWEGIAYRGNYAFGASDVADGNMYSFDITDLTSPKPIDVLTNLVPLWRPNSLTYNNGYLYAANMDDYEVNSKFSAFSLADPNNPAYVGGSVHDYSNNYQTAANGNYLYTTRNWGGLGVYDVSNPTFPLLVDTKTDITRPGGIVVHGNYLYAGDSSNGMFIYDVTNPADPQLVSHYTDINHPGSDSLVYKDGYIYSLWNWDNSFEVIDVRDPANPVRVLVDSDDTNAWAFTKLSLSGNYLYVTNQGDDNTRHDSLTIYNVTAAASPQLVGQYVADSGSDGYSDVQIYGNYAFVAASFANRIDVIDITDPSAPTFNQSVGSGDPSLQGVNGLVVHGDNLYTISQYGQSLNTYSMDVLGASTGGGVLGTGSSAGGGTNAGTPAAPAKELANTSEKFIKLILAALVFIIAAVTAAWLTRADGTTYKVTGR